MQTYTSDDDPRRPLAPTWFDYKSWLKKEWSNLLTAYDDEPPMQRFLESHPSLLPGSVDNIGPGGHHGAWWDAVITQPKLKGIGRNRLPDFMWIRRDTSSTRPILIEIEAPKKQWFTDSLVQTAEVTQALDQISEWRAWFGKDENRLIFQQTYVPRRFSDRILEPQYVLILGRSREFQRGGRHREYSKARTKRDFIARHDLHLFTYDMLTPRYEASDYGTIRWRESYFEAVRLSPMFSTGSHLLGEGSLLQAVDDITEAASHTQLISSERREYVLRRWLHWREALTNQWEQNGRGILSGGWE